MLSCLECPAGYQCADPRFVYGVRVCVYVCCVRVYVCCVRVYVCLCVYVWAHVCTYTCVHAYIRTYACVSSTHECMSSLHKHTYTSYSVAPIQCNDGSGGSRN